jgi:hypothetical protein
MKTLTTDAAAVALGVDRKTLDNVLAREGRSLISVGSRGRSRRIPVDVLEVVAVAMVLNRDLGVSVAKGLELAARVVAAPTLPVQVGSLSSVTFDLGRLRLALDVSISDALESTAEPTRGRPRL